MTGYDKVVTTSFHHKFFEVVYEQNNMATKIRYFPPLYMRLLFEILIFGMIWMLSLLFYHKVFVEVILEETVRLFLCSNSFTESW